MRIGLDARKLRDGGIGTYIRGCLEAMARQAGGNELVALLAPEDVGRIAWPGGAVREVAVSAAKYGLAEHFVVPSAARAAGVELLHAPHYTLPLGWPGPSVVTIHDLIHLEYPRFFPPGAAAYARLVAGQAVRRARLVLVGSSYTRDQVAGRLQVPPSRIRVIALAPPRDLRPADRASIEAFRAARGLPAAYLLYVGARKRHKNLELVIHALARFPSTERPPFVLGGEAWGPAEPLARLARELRVADRISFSGPLEGGRDLACLYGGAALYVQPSWVEGFGLPPLEAMGCGVPVLSSTGGALPETLGDAAVLLPPGDAGAWAGTIQRLLGDPGRLQELRRLGLAHAARFSWDDTARRTLDAYREALLR